MNVVTGCNVFSVHSIFLVFYLKIVKVVVPIFKDIYFAMLRV